MRIAMVSEHASPLATLGGVDAGGQNVHVAALARAMGARGAEVVVHTRRDAADLPRYVPLAPGVVVHQVDAGPPTVLPKDDLLPLMEEFADVLAAEWRDRPPDVVHSHFWMSAVASLSAARRLGIPVVHTFHALGVVKRRYQGELDTSPADRLDIERGLVADVDHIVATCTDEVFELLRLGAASGRLTVVPCGVDLQAFRPRGPADARRPGLNRLLCVGRLVPRKGVGNVISALEHVPDTELVIAGGPPRPHLRDDHEACRLAALAAEHGVADRVDFRGRVERSDLPALLRSSDAVVCAPWYEPFGIVPLEAMACGVPVVASAVGGMIDTVVDGTTGVHVPPRDPDRLASALRDMLDDEDRRASFGREGVVRARRLYDWNRIAATTLDVYSKVVHRSARRSRRFRLAPSAREHLAELTMALEQLDRDAGRLDDWGTQLARAAGAGARVLTLGGGRSAAVAEHLAAELVGRPASALCLNADAIALGALSADYGLDQVLARELGAHSRDGDVVVAFVGGGRSEPLIAALRAARRLGLTTFVLTGEDPGQAGGLADEVLSLPATSRHVLQELQLVTVHLLSAAVERELALSGTPTRSRALVR
jgi:glycosyltransferase involved in cell wall biosynthesis/phosphoheptose isomerase